MPLPAVQDRALLDMGRELHRRGYRFVTPTPLTHQQVNARPENALAKDLAGVFGWNRPFDRDVLPAPLYERLQVAGALEHSGAHLRSRLRVSSLDGELLLHSAFPTDEADAVFLGPDTYRFANALQAHLAGRTRCIHRAADIGSGSGAGAILIARCCPEAHVLALDINPAALRLTAINAAIAAVGNLEARHSDLLGGVSGRFDLVVANPPYLVDPSGRTYRHGGGALGAGLSLAIVEAALPRLAPGGSLLLYTGVAMHDNRDPFLARIRPWLQGWRWRYQEVDPDVFGEELLGGAYTHCERIAAVVLKVTRP